MTKTYQRFTAMHIAKSCQDKIVLENQIDQLVYELYDLTEEEIKIVEGI